MGGSSKGGSFGLESIHTFFKFWLLDLRMLGTLENSDVLWYFARARPDGLLDYISNHENEHQQKNEGKWKNWQDKVVTFLFLIFELMDSKANFGKKTAIDI